jgi:hypothetical protein
MGNDERRRDSREREFEIKLPAGASLREISLLIGEGQPKLDQF